MPSHENSTILTSGTVESLKMKKLAHACQKMGSPCGKEAIWDIMKAAKCKAHKFPPLPPPPSWPHKGQPTISWPHTEQPPSSWPHTEQPPTTSELPTNLSFSPLATLRSLCRVYRACQLATYCATMTLTRI